MHRCTPPLFPWCSPLAPAGTLRPSRLRGTGTDPAARRPATRLLPLLSAEKAHRRSVRRPTAGLLGESAREPTGCGRGRAARLAACGGGAYGGVGLDRRWERLGQQSQVRTTRRIHAPCSRASQSLEYPAGRPCGAQLPGLGDRAAPTIFPRIHMRTAIHTRGGVSPPPLRTSTDCIKADVSAPRHDTRGGVVFPYYITPGSSTYHSSPSRSASHLNASHPGFGAGVGADGRGGG